MNGDGDEAIHGSLFFLLYCRRYDAPTDLFEAGCACGDFVQNEQAMELSKRCIIIEFDS
jgi:hypothetical protein